MRLLACGGRDFIDGAYVEAVLSIYPITLLICGMARGADTLAYQYARANNIPTLEFPADWQRYGKRAGMVRNTVMLTEGKPDLVIAFPGGRGTEMMCDIAKRAGVEVIHA